ncbi:MAG: hypothetical protein IPL96_15840 [Holophagaceae bacterium]|nr:hypothetical protein [Holophagaceae bacterium]
MLPRPSFQLRFLCLSLGLGALCAQTIAGLRTEGRHANHHDAWAPDLHRTESSLNLALLVKS